MSKNLSAKYYQEKNERIQKKLAKVIKIILKMKKRKKQRYGLEHYENLSEDAKLKLVEYRIKYHKMRKYTLL